MKPLTLCHAVDGVGYGFIRTVRETIERLASGEFPAGFSEF